MALTLELSPELEDRLRRESGRHGVLSDQYAVQLLDRHLPMRRDRGAELVALLQSWIDDDDAEEQKETAEYLIRTLDQDRLSDRKLFPSELRGVTW